MNDSKLNRYGRRIQSRTEASATVADAAGMVWTHANPAELYRWISRRNALLRIVDSITSRNPEVPDSGWHGSAVLRNPGSPATTDFGDRGCGVPQTHATPVRTIGKL